MSWLNVTDFLKVIATGMEISVNIGKVRKIKRSILYLCGNIRHIASKSDQLVMSFILRKRIEIKITNMITTMEVQFLKE